MAHAFLSPSGAPAWTRCLAKPWREKDLPDQSSGAADEGTAAHYLLEQCLDKGVDAKHFIGNAIDVTGLCPLFVSGGAYPVGPDMIQPVQAALDFIRGKADGATVYPEQQLSITFLTGERLMVPVYDENGVQIGETEADATGTADAICVKGKVLHVFDLKYGRGVQVYAEGNEQLLIYGAAALEEFDILGEIETIHLHIVQPRLDHYESWVLGLNEFHNRVHEIRRTAENIMEGSEELEATPGEKQCRFCKVKATCEEYRTQTLETVADGFVDLDKGFVQVSIEQAEKLLAQSFGIKPAAIDFEYTPEAGGRFLVKKPSIRPMLEEAETKLATATDARLATLLDSADMLEGLVKAVRAEVERRLLDGSFTDARYKLVEGRMGNREFSNEPEAEKQMKAMRLKTDQMYNRKLISPTQAEALLKADNPRKWAKLEALIVRSPGKPSVAPASDKRPALAVTLAEDFEVLEENPLEKLYDEMLDPLIAAVEHMPDDGSDLV